VIGFFSPWGVVFDFLAVCFCLSPCVEWGGVARRSGRAQSSVCGDYLSPKTSPFEGLIAIVGFLVRLTSP